MTEVKTLKGLLSQAQLNFIQSELGRDADSLSVLGDNDIDNLYDRICDIEVEETMNAGSGELSERGKMAEGIVTLIGNALYRLENEPEE